MYVDNSRSKFYLDWTRNVENIIKTSFMHLHNISFTESIFIKPKHNWQLFENNFHSELHKNPTNSAVACIR